MLFPDYIRAHRDKPTDPPVHYKAGRIYYISGYGLDNWARKRRNEKLPKKVVIWYNDRFLCNLFLPRKSLIKLTDRSVNDIERFNAWKIRVHDMGHFVRLDYLRRTLKQGSMISNTIDLEHSFKKKNKSIEVFGHDTVNCVKGNVGLVHDQLHEGSYIITETGAKDRVNNDGTGDN